ncbi:Isoleucyl-tRNA synthetase [Elusimicrobium minutum Pei191]|uniref:Isoleucine--tRNA ligase n=1 Tax=Elusimicrobium minutum (strain Pei191) TaxID=445932 RepID=B2KDV0_ELUMP|nr:isoleucine--tRNA ligase [Elusimicrobium minutum]ACC98696.1 Isoleucyl-tRNA synthetase [Elusimicrobium minutum Pei191]
MSNNTKPNNNKYSKTVLLPKTDFPMRAGLAQKEPKFVEFWKTIKLYEKMQKLRDGKEVFMLHDGPPYANGRIHIGHAMDKTLKDMVLKSRHMQGFQTPYIPGWDCHGLPIEQALMKEMKIDKKSIKEEDVPGFRKKAREFADKFVDIQMQGFERLGVQGDWANYYSTMAKRYEGNVIGVFLDFIEKGLAYRGTKTIFWCPTCETALADAETEYKDKVSQSIYLRFKLAEPFKGKANVSLVIWTTTPWTIPANKATAVNKDEDYVLLKDNKTGEYYIVADKLAENFKNKSGYDITKEEKFSGNDLVGLKYKHPLLDRLNPVIWTDFVAMDTGVGLVHVAPAHGEDDAKAGQIWNLEVFGPVDEKGIFTKEAGEFAGQHIFKANAEIIKRLNELGNLIKEETIDHSYPHCWRCKQPIIFRATEQWFLSIDGQNLRSELTKAVESVDFYPKAGVSRIGNMVKMRPDWCLTRQRFWGTPATIFYCDDCKTPQVDAKLFAHIKQMALDNGGDFWFTFPNEKILPEGYKCTKCGGTHFVKEKDILDVWLDSGCSWRAVLKDRGLKYPADMYLEGADQHRGWFQSSLIPSVALEGKSPFRQILTHGFVLDQHGHAMHKSLGNSVEPHEVFDKYGADILRLWVSLSDYQDDIRISDEILSGPVDSYRRLRNTFRYAMGSLFDYDPEIHKMKPEEMTEIDRYMLSKLDTLIKESLENYDIYEFRKVVRGLIDFCILDLSSFMLDASKDRLYTLGTDAQTRRSAQNALYEILIVLLKLLAPVLSFTTEEAWQELKKTPAGAKLEESIFLSDFPKSSSFKHDAKLEEKWSKIRTVRENVLKKLEEARSAGLIGSSLEANVIFSTTSKEELAFLEENKDLWPEIAIVSKAEIKNEGGEEILITIEHAPGAKCPRCWQWKEDIGENSAHAEVCVRCAGVLEKEGITVNEDVNVNV